MWFVFLLWAFAEAACPDGTEQTSLTGCQGTMTRVLRNAPTGNCDTDFTVWVDQATASSEIAYSLLSGDFTAKTFKVEDSIDLPDGAIDTDDIAASAVTNAKIADGAVNNVKIASKTIMADKIADNTLTASQIGPNAIGSSELSNNAVTTAKIANDAVSSDKLAHSIKIHSDLSVGRNVDISGSTMMSGAFYTQTIQVLRVSTFDGTIHAGTIQGRGTQKKLTMNALLYVNSGGTTHANSGFGGAIGYQTYLRNQDTNVKRQDWEDSGQKLSIWATGAIQSAVYIGASDLRIKKDVRDIKDHEALQQIRQLDAKFYKYRDPVKRGDAEVLGFIAQDVKNTIPHAVYPKTDFIPNEMRSLDVQWKTDAETGHKRMVSTEMLAPGRYKFVMIKGEEEVEEKLTTKDGRTLLTDKDTPYTTDQTYDNVFLYGKEVDDFLTIDKNKIFAVAYAALQQVDKNQRRLQEKVNSLEQRLAMLESKMNI